MSASRRTSGSTTSTTCTEHSTRSSSGARDELLIASCCGPRSWSSVLIALLIVVACAAPIAGEASLVVGITRSAVASDLRIRTERAGQPHGASGGGIVGVFGSDHSSWRDAVLYPSLQRGLHIVNWIARRRDLLPHASEARRSQARNSNASFRE